MSREKLTIDNYLGTDVPAFEIRWFKNTPTSETVGAAICRPLRFEYNLFG